MDLVGLVDGGREVVGRGCLEERFFVRIIG